MPTPKGSVSSRVTIQNPRPRKYASAAERQKALRERFPTLCVRVEQEQADFMKRIADEQGRTLQDVHLAFIKYANGRGNQWLTQGLKGFAPLPRFEEPPKENPMKTEILERAKLPDGTRVRLQKRGKAYDVITNSTGITWRYLEKAVSEERARNAFDLYTMQRKKNPIKITQAKRKPTPAQIAARERFAAMARSGAFKRKNNPMVISKQADESLSRKGSRGYVRELLDRYSDDGHVVSVKKTRSGSIGIALDGGRLLTVESARKKLEDHYGITERMGRRSNPAKKTVSQKISQLTREGYPQKQAVAIALSEERAGKVKRNPRASNPIKPKKQRMLNISWLTPGGQREMKSVPIDFVFTHYVGNVAERFFVRTENGQLIVSEYSTGGRVGQVPYTMRAAAGNDRDAAKRYLGEMLSRIGAERFKAAVKQFEPIN